MNSKIQFGKTSYSNYLYMASPFNEGYGFDKQIVFTPEGHLLHNNIQYGGHIAGLGSSRQLKVIPTDVWDNNSDYTGTVFLCDSYNEETQLLLMKCIHINSANSADYEFDFIKSDSTLPVSVNFIFYTFEEEGNIDTFSTKKYRFVVDHVETDTDDMGPYYLQSVYLKDDVDENTVFDCFMRVTSGESYFVIANGGSIGVPIEQAIQDKTLIAAIRHAYPQISIGSNASSGLGGISFGSSCGGMGYFGTTFGRKSASLNDYAFAHGYRVHSAGTASFGTGAYHQITGKYSQALGSSNIVSGIASIAFNSSNNISGNNSAAFGNNNKVSVNNSIAFGAGNNVSGTYSIAGGQGCSVTNTRGFAFGNTCTVKGINSMAIGANLSITSNNCLVVGQCNTDRTNARFIVGHGDDVDHRRNLFTVTPSDVTVTPQLVLDNGVSCSNLAEFYSGIQVTGEAAFESDVIIRPGTLQLNEATLYSEGNEIRTKKVRAYGKLACEIENDAYPFQIVDNNFMEEIRVWVGEKTDDNGMKHFAFWYEAKCTRTAVLQMEYSSDKALLRLRHKVPATSHTEAPLTNIVSSTNPRMRYSAMKYAGTDPRTLSYAPGHATGNCRDGTPFNLGTDWENVEYYEYYYSTSKANYIF